MEEAKKKLRLCLILVVVTAVITGMLYYFGDVKNRGKVSEGTLVKQTECGFRMPETSV